MKITINDHRKIFAIQEEFSTVFPYLKLEFLSKPHEPSGKPGEKPFRNDSKTLGECRTIHNKGEITITPNMTIAELEERFEDVYGLGVQVFCKSDTKWVETSATKKFTLEEQNRAGKSLDKTASK